MKTFSFLTKIAFLLLVGLAFNFTSAPAADKDEYSFKVKNKTDMLIKSILTSEDKETWGIFKLGEGIPAGETVKLVWDKSTNSQGCKQWVKAVFEGGDESKPAKFDFCEDDLVITFEKN